MRIDPTLCHRVLVAVEGDAKAGTGQGVKIAIEGCEWEVVGQHIHYLVETEMLKGLEVTNLQSPHREYIITDITPKGRAYLDAHEPAAPKNKIGF